MSGYEDFGSSLSAANAGVGVAECHGFLCAQLCGPHFPPEELWQEFLDLRTADEAQAGSCYEHVRQLLVETRRQIKSDEFNFQLLLPDDDVELAQRVQALAGWCQGFMSGLGLAEDLPVQLFSGEVQEWLKDMDMIAHADVDEDGADDEMALLQVVEHVRTGVMLIMEETRGHADNNEDEDDEEIWH